MSMPFIQCSSLYRVVSALFAHSLCTQTINIGFSGNCRTLCVVVSSKVLWYEPLVSYHLITLSTAHHGRLVKYKGIIIYYLAVSVLDIYWFCVCEVDCLIRSMPHKALETVSSLARWS